MSVVFLLFKKNSLNLKEMVYGTWFHVLKVNRLLELNRSFAIKLMKMEIYTNKAKLVQRDVINKVSTMRRHTLLFPALKRLDSFWHLLVS